MEWSDSLTGQDGIDVACCEWSIYSSSSSIRHLCFITHFPQKCPCHAWLLHTLLPQDSPHDIKRGQVSGMEGGATHHFHLSKGWWMLLAQSGFSRVQQLGQWQHLWHSSGSYPGQCGPCTLHWPAHGVCDDVSYFGLHMVSVMIKAMLQPTLTTH
jgi:hypothetical protein